MPNVFHVAPVDRRDSILKLGVCPPSIHGRRKAFDFCKDAVYFTTDLDRATETRSGLYHEKTHEIWECLPPLQAECDPGWGGAWRTPEVMRPIRIVIGPQ